MITSVFFGEPSGFNLTNSEFASNSDFVQSEVIAPITLPGNLSANPAPLLAAFKVAPGSAAAPEITAVAAEGIPNTTLEVKEVLTLTVERTISFGCSNGTKPVT